MTQPMLMPELVLPSLANQQRQFLGMDTLNRCLDRDQFLAFPHHIEYCFNSRGFRGPEWPTAMSDLQNAIWCLGDSYTVGIGSSLSHTWPFRLGTICYDQLAINVSLAGASNEWIADAAENIVANVNPRHMVVMWSLTRRRQNPDTSLSPEDRRLPYSDSTVEQDWDNFLQCKKRVDSVINAVHFSVPEFHACYDDTSPIPHLTRLWNDIRGADWPADPPTTMEALRQLPQQLLHEIENVHQCLDRISTIIDPGVIQVHRLDLSRDGRHFDLITANWVASQAADRLIY
jgi:hypothetical protein